MKIQRTAIASLVLVALAAVGAAPALANLTVIVPYGANSLPAGTPGFKYVILPIDSALPGFEMPAFDDSTWTAGIAPFGGAGGNEGSCGWLWPQVMTPWNPNNSDLFVRFKTELCPGARSVRIGVSIDNDLALFVNGSEVEPDGGCAVPSLDGLCQTENCAVPDKLVFSIPYSLLAPG